MKGLLAKIKESIERKDAQTKCAMIAQVYEQMSFNLEKMDNDLGAAGLEVDVAAFDEQLNELEAVCDELLKILNPELQKVLKFLKPRFKSHMYRHKQITWEQVEQRLREADPKKIWSLNEMERTGGEPDVIKIDQKTGEVIFYDCSVESPTGRRNCVYDKEGEEILKRDYPDEPYNGNAVDMASAMKVEMLNEEQYRELQSLGEFDRNSWSWLKTPIDKRKGGVALRADRNAVDVGVFEDFPYDPGDDRAWRGWLGV